LRYSIPFSGLKECFAGSKILAREMSGTSSCIKRPRLGGSIVLVSPTNSLFIVCGGSGRAVVVDGCRCRQKGTVRLNCTLERRYPSHVGVNGTPTQSKGSVVAWLRRCGGPHCYDCLEPQLAAVLTVQRAVMSEPVDIVLGSLVLGFLFSLMIGASVTAVVL
jgi:hypothetical protein